MIDDKWVYQGHPKAFTEANRPRLTPKVLGGVAVVLVAGVIWMGVLIAIVCANT